MLDDRDEIEKALISCDHCAEEFTFKALYHNTVSHGIIFLVGKDHGYMGVVCPKCFKTTLKKAALPEIGSIKSELNSVIGYDKIKNDSFRYYSFPYHRDYLKITNPSLRIHHVSHIGKNYYNAEDFELHCSHSGNSKWITDGHRSYFWGDPSVGPAMTIWWFLEENLKDLLSIENDTGLKVFPRYIAYEPIYSEIDRFCWEYHLKLNLLERLNPLFAEKEKKVISPKNKITKNYEFLKILDTPHYSSPNYSYDPPCVYFKNDKVSAKTKRIRLVNRFDENQNITPLNHHINEHIKTLLWNNFNETNVVVIRLNLIRGYN